jgi:hypothetical protein
MIELEKVKNTILHPPCTTTANIYRAWTPELELGFHEPKVLNQQDQSWII